MDAPRLVVPALVLAGAVLVGAFGIHAVARAQCPSTFGDSAFSGDPAPPCRAAPPSAPPIRFGAELQVGWAEDDAPLSGATSGIGLYADVALASFFGLGIRGTHRGMASDGTSEDGLEAFVVTGGPRFTFFTEPARHEAFRLGLDAGGLLIVDGVGASGPMVEVSLERQAGNLLRGRASPRPAHGTALEVGIALRYQQGLGTASDYRAFIVSSYVGTELFSRLPEGAPPRRTRPGLEYTLSIAGAAGAALGDHGGFGGLTQLAFGLPIGKWISVEAAADATILSQGEAGPSVAYSFLGGLRSPRWTMLFAEVLAGYSFVFAPEPRAVDSGPILDVAVGAHLPDILGCGFGVTVAPFTRFGLGDRNRDLIFVGAKIALRYDNLIRAAECGY